MPTVLNLKPEDIDTIEKRSKYTVTVIGCGQKGIHYANTFAESGFNVVCTDADPSVIKKVAKGKTPSSEQEIETKLKSLISKGQLIVISELKKAVSQSDIIVIAVTAKIDEKNKSEPSEIVNTCKQVGKAIHQGALVIYGGVAGFGFTEGTIKETLENTSGLKIGQDFGLAYIPIQVPGLSIANSELKVAAIDKISLHAASTILKTITRKVKEISDVKTAETAMLFTVVKQDVNRALANELAVFCENANIDYFEVLKLLDCNEPNFWPTIVEEDNKNEVYLLLESAENLNAKLRLPALARQINEDMIKHAVNLTQDALRSYTKTLRRARVAILGSTNQAKATGAFVKMLELKGAKVSLYDPAAKKELLDSRVVKTSLNEAVEGADCIIILSEQEQAKHLNIKKLKPLMKTPSIIVDLTGTVEPQRVETEGFIFFGLGRGTDKK